MRCVGLIQLPRGTLSLSPVDVKEFYTVTGWTAMLCCDNKRALEVSAHHQRRIRPSAKCADIRRSLKAVKPLQRGTFRYVHVYGHMDRMLRWEQLSLPQQLNCVCDTLAKRLVTAANQPRLSRSANPAPTERGRGSCHMGYQNHRRHLSALAFPR